VHVRGGQFYRWAVRGWVHAGDARAAEARRLLDLRYRLSALVADEYCRAGFATVVQDSIEDLDGFLAATPRMGLWLDTSAQTAPETVAEILRRPSEAIVDEDLP
jgi:hypothetical protein